MKKEHLKIYHIDMKYIRNLSNKDDNVMSTSPQINKEKRPFVGIVVVCDSKKYCIPLSSPKPKHYKMKNDKDFSKIYDKKQNLIGVLNFNSMIPVDNGVIKMVDVKVALGDSLSDKYYKNLLSDQLDWCNNNQEAIEIKANKLYTLVTETPDKMRNLTRRCCDFKKLEAVLEKWLEKEVNQQATVQTSVLGNKSKSQRKAPFSASKLKSEAQRIHNQSQNSTIKNKSRKKDDHSL